MLSRAACSHYYSSRPDFERGREPPHAADGLAGSREESSRLRIKGVSQRIKKMRATDPAPFFIHSVPSAKERSSLNASCEEAHGDQEASCLQGLGPARASGKGALPSSRLPASQHAACTHAPTNDTARTPPSLLQLPTSGDVRWVSPPEQPSLEQPSWHTAASVRRTLVSGSTRSRPTSARCTRRSRSPPQETRRRSSRPPPTRSSKRCARPFASATGARAAPPNFPLVCGARSPQPHACHAALQGHDRHQGHA